MSNVNIITKIEINKFMGLLILSSMLEFSIRSSLFGNTPTHKYMLELALGKLQASRHRLNDIWRII